MRLDDEQLAYLRDGMAVRAQYYGGADIDTSDEYALTLALAWFRAYWHDRLKRKDEARR